jgi:hypothetical protein
MYQDRFKATLRFLVTSMALNGNEKAISKQAADTMHTVVSDQDLYLRFKSFAYELFPIILEMSQSINISLFWEFLSDFIRQYQAEIGNQAPIFMKAIVARVEKELAKCHAKGERNNNVINKCMHCIQTMIMGESNYLPA